jgi:hypothetical protein
VVGIQDVSPAHDTVEETAQRRRNNAPTGWKKCMRATLAFHFDHTLVIHDARSLALRAHPHQ